MEESIMTLVKRCLLTLIALMVFCMSSAALANSGKLTEDEAWEKAFALVEQQTGYSKDQLKKNQILDGDDIWYVTIVLKKHWKMRTDYIMSKWIMMEN